MDVVVVAVALGGGIVSGATIVVVFDILGALFLLFFDTLIVFALIDLVLLALQTLLAITRSIRCMFNTRALCSTVVRIVLEQNRRNV